MLRWLLVVLVVVAACGDSDTSAETTSSAPPPAGIAAGAITLEITSDGGTAGGELLVTVTLTNGTDQPAMLVRPTRIPNFVAFTVTDVSGSRMTFYGPQAHLKPLGDDGFVTVEPGLSTSETLDLEPGWHLESGTYTVVAEYRNPANGSHEGGRAIIFEHSEGPTSPPIEVVVSP